MRKRPLTALFIVLLAVVVGACGGDDDGRAENLFLSDQQLNIAHRGGNLLAPEETIEAWHSALDVGADVLEMDLHSTSDGVLVLLHDNRVNRTTNGTGRINELTYAEVSELDAGYNHTTDGGATYPFRGMGVKIPTLEEVFLEFPDDFMVIEIKQEEPSIIDAFNALLTEYDMRDKVVVASFDAPTIQAFRAAAPDVLTSFALDEAVELFFLSEEALADYTPPAQFLQVPPTFEGLEVLTPEFVARARRLGLRFHVWDVYGAEQMRELLDLGMDGLIVDDPETLGEILRER
jgi:glycerophosphoryl diester phosphodiesterase